MRGSVRYTHFMCYLIVHFDTRQFTQEKVVERQVVEKAHVSTQQRENIKT